MAFLLLTMLVCLLVCAAITLYVAYPARGRSLPSALASTSAQRRGAGAGVPAPRDHETEPAQEARR